MSKMSVVLNDSDCLIQEHHISCITLDDSHDEQSNDGQLQPSAVDDMEEGELDDDVDGTSSENICEIKFSSNQNYQKFGDLITEALREKLNDHENEKPIEIVSMQTCNGVTLCVKYACNFPNTVESTCQPTGHDEVSEEKTDVFDKELSPDLTGISELFTIDINPAVKLDSVKVPSYKRAIKDVMLDEEAAAHKRQKQEEKNMKASKASNCFNCGESGHSIKECTMPHNTRRIKMAKKAFSKVERYHVDVEQRFAHLRPGTVSDKMREALGLRKGELPFFFYRMRVLGYPPGWLEDAKVEQSGINLFNSDGSRILHSDEDDGDTESSINHKYNASKIIDFPGFNQDPGENFFDDYKYHNVPPMCKTQSKEEFVKTLGDSILKIYKRKKLKDFPKSTADDNANDSFHTEVFDMEIEDPDTTAPCNIEFVRPPPPPEPPQTNDDVPPPPPPLETEPTDCENVETQSEESIAMPGSPLSPSLAELERKKNLLLQELENGNKSISVIEIEDSLVDEILELDNSTQEEQENLPDNVALTDAQASNDTQGSSEGSKDSYKSSESHIEKDIIEKSYMGTPVLHFSPYDSLPNGENFKVGVSDVINFENLPDSTGKYENMKEVIKKVRDVIHKLHSDE